MTALWLLLILLSGLIGYALGVQHRPPPPWNDPFECADDLMNWLNTLEESHVKKSVVYRWAMEWRPYSWRDVQC